MSAEATDQEVNQCLSDTEDSAVLVEHTDGPPELADEDVLVGMNQTATSASGAPRVERVAHASQIVSIGEADGGDGELEFVFHRTRLAEILSQVPASSKVAVVSVVGAFRTGKSFLLSWFLRYLHHATANGKEETASDEKPWYRQFDTLGNNGFEWKAGSERNTTGIWMWSQPHVMEREDGSPLAVLLVDTQGMFDHETSMDLTACIFGFSTLLSSYQIYNVDKRIQEDNLQQLALFSEYARTAANEEKQEGEDDTGNAKKPFQKLEFLVRDWQHFEDEDEEPDQEAMTKSMEEYLEKVIAEREAKDLKETRQQIVGCFEELTCYGLCHPGFAVTKKKYEGDVNQMEDLFLKLLDNYCRRVFNANELEAKIIHGRELTAVELGSYIEAYAELFHDGVKFPTAATMLEATVSGNNNNAVMMANKRYKEIMDHIAGTNCTNYQDPEELAQEHEKALEASIRVFRDIANFGSEISIQDARSKLLTENSESFRVYKSLNDGRNPLLGLETYILPIVVGLASYILRWFTDLTCSPYAQVCKAGSDALSHISAVVFFFMMIIGATKFQQIMQLVKRVQKAISLLMDENKVKKE